MVPFVLLAFSLAALMVCGGITASAAFLAQRDVQSVCDGAAIAAANAIDEGSYFGSADRSEVPLTDQSVAVAVTDYLADASAGPGTEMDAWSARTDGRTVQVDCTRNVALPFADLFLGGEDLPRTATASARSPFAP